MISAKTIFILFLTVLTGQFAMAANKCVEIFPKSEITAELKTSVDTSIKALAAFRLDIDVRQAQGKNSIENTILQQDYLEKEQELVSYLEKYQIMTRSEMIGQMKIEIADLQKRDRKKQKDLEKKNKKDEENLKEQSKIVSTLAINGHRAVLHRINPGSFKMGREGDKHKVTLTKPFEMMATPTTQAIWKKIAVLAKNPPANALISTAPSTDQGDLLPVTNISFDQVLGWLDALNKLSQHGVPELSEIIVGHKKGDIYRLPTSAEWEYVVRAEGKANDRYHFGNDPSLLPQYAWYWDNTNGGASQTLAPVASLKPLLIGRKAFYDMYGNVNEWTADASPEVRKNGDVDPYTPGHDDSRRIVRGGAHNNTADHLESGASAAFKPESKYPTLGFRFVREVRP